MLEYSLRRSRRKTLAVYIMDDASVEVRAPMRLPTREIEAFLYAKSSWIEANIEKRRLCLESAKAYIPDYGGLAFLRGGLYRVTADNEKTGFQDGAFFVPHGLSRDNIARRLAEDYKRRSAVLFPERAAFFAPVLGLRRTEPEIRISSAKTRWGSCSANGRISLAWRLLMARDGAIDYVVVHELCHILRHDHSRRFWSLVEAAAPDYREQRAYLRELARELSAVDWL